MVTLYSTPTCAPCRVAEKQLIAAGIAVDKIDLTTNPEALADLKERLDKPTIQTPVLGFQGELFGMSDLRNIILSAN